MFNFFKNRNPILNSPYDITTKLVNDIIENNIKSLTINYEFTRKRNDDEPFNLYSDYRREYNPFYRANLICPLKRIEFEIILGPKVKSLAFAFGGIDEILADYRALPIDNFKDLEFLNLKDVSRISDMSGLFYGASSFNPNSQNFILAV